MIIIQLFLAFTQIGLFAFGGGYATLPLIEKEIVIARHWMSHAEFLNVITISQLTPGPIGINAATFTGYKIAGYCGGAVATFAFCLPSVVIVLLLMNFLKKHGTNPQINKVVKGIRPAVIALMVAAAYSIATGGGITDLKGIIIAIVSFIVLQTHKMNPIIVLVLAGIVGIIVYL